MVRHSLKGKGEDDSEGEGDGEGRGGVAGVRGGAAIGIAREDYVDGGYRRTRI